MDDNALKKLVNASIILSNTQFSIINRTLQETIFYIIPV